MSRQKIVRIHLRVRIRQDHAVKFESFHQIEGDQKSPFPRQRLVAADYLRRLVAQKFPDLLKAPPVSADDGREPFFLLCGINERLQSPQIVVAVRAAHFHRRRARSLHRGRIDPLLPRQKSREDLRDLRRRPVAREQRQFHRFAALFAEQLPDLFKGHRPRPDRLELVSQHHKLRSVKISPQHHELSRRVVLHLVDHDVFHVFVAHSGQQYFEPDPFRAAQLLSLREPHADLLYIKKRKMLDRTECAAEFVPDPVLLPHAGLVRLRVRVHAVESGAPGGFCLLSAASLFILIPLHPADLDPGDLRQPVSENVKKPDAGLNL